MDGERTRERRLDENEEVEWKGKERPFHALLFRSLLTRRQAACGCSRPVMVISVCLTRFMSQLRLCVRMPFHMNTHVHTHTVRTH